jgi:hypothetical protein
VADRLWGAGVTLAGIGIFAARNGRLGLVEAVLERVGRAVVGEIVARDEARSSLWLRARSPGTLRGAP